MVMIKRKPKSGEYVFKDKVFDQKLENQLSDVN